MNERRYQRKVGAAVFLLLAVICAFVMARQGRSVGPGLTVWVEMAHAGPLIAGAKVRVAGLVVGEISEVSFLPRQGGGARVTLRLWIDKRRAWLIHERSDFFVNQPSLLSEPYLEVGLPERGDPGPVIRDGAIVRGVDPSSIDRLLVRSYAVLRELGALMENDFPEMKELGQEIDALAHTFDELSKVTPPGMFAGMGGGGGGAGLGRLALEAAQTSFFIDAVKTETAGWEGTLVRGRALVVRGRATVEILRGRVTALTARLDELRASLSPEQLARVDAALARVDTLIRQVDEVVAGAEALAALIGRGEGSIAAFAADMEIADEVKAVTKLLKERPWLLGHPDMGHAP